MGLFQHIPPAEAEHVSSDNVDDKLRLLTRVTSLRFEQTFRGLDPAAVERLLGAIAAHEPNLRSGFEHRCVHGDWPSDPTFHNSISVLQNVSSEDLPSSFRGCDPMQVERVLEAVRELPMHLERD